MQEFAIYSVIPPEGLRGDPLARRERKVEAAAALKITAPDLLSLGLIDEIVPEPIGGAHNDHDAATAAGRSGARRRRSPSCRALSVDERLARPLREVPAAWDGKGTDFVDVGAPDDRAEAHEVASSGSTCRATTTTAAALAARAERPPDGRAPAVPARLGDPDGGGSLPEPVARPPPRSVAARRHGPGRRRGSSGRWRSGERIAIHGDYDVDGITSTVILRRALEMLGGDVDPLHPRAAAGRLRPPAGGDRAAARRQASTLIVSVDCGIRGADAAPARARARRRPHHHRPSRAGGHAAARARRDQPEAARLHLSRQAPRRRRRGAEAGAGAVHASGQEQVAAGLRQDRGASARWPTSCRSSARTASSRSSASSRCRAGRTRSACARCSTRRA